MKVRLRLSFSIIWVLILLAVGAVAGIYYMRFSLQPSIGAAASTVASAVNTAQITIFNYIYVLLAVALTDMENHRTDTDYQDSMIAKLFLFQFVNSVRMLFEYTYICIYVYMPLM